ncbi:NADP-dependent isocitrate dehydrogenase, partial [Vibrio sp. 10N.222.52.B7]
AKKNPHSMGAWSADSKSHVSSMDDKDFFGSEKSVTIEGATEVSIEFVGKDGAKKTLKPAFAL